MAKEQKQFVKIQSSINIRVTAGLQFDDYTKKNSDVPDRMKIAAQWPKLMCLIKAGRHSYPSEIAEWESVKALQKSGILTIGEFTDEDDNDALQQKIDLNNAIAEIKSKSLADIAGE